ncbi:MAG: copper transporter [Firmicutes bacterium]|jgi:hypothetical protein|nr:copper transporter [Bacillota bacterium]HQD39848.1 copper transporter [Bacillota bacterium]
MIIDFRYHIASLAAVFLALGLGILIGSSLLSDEKLYEQQGKLVDRLEADLASLRQDKRNLEEEIVSLELALKREEQFGQAALPLLTRNKLTGQRLAIVQLTQTTVSSEVSALKNCLQQAGAEVISTTSLLRYSDDEQLAEVLESEGDSMEQLINHLAQTLAMGLGREGLAPLERLGYLQLGGDYHLPVQTVILYLGNVTVPKEVATSLVQACSEYQVRVAAVENSGAPSSSLSEKGILMVDNIDQTSGKVALIYALATDGLGHFGIKEGAQAFLPELGKQEQ